MEQTLGRPITSHSANEIAEVCGFGPATDRPVGRVDCVLSGITGKPLRYFTPDPLPELLRRARLVAGPERCEVEPLLAVLLVREAARNTSTRVIDLPQARRFLGVLQNNNYFPTHSDLVSLAKAVNPKIQGLREEIIFVGGVVPTSSRHIYAPHAALPELMHSLVEGLAGDDIQSCDPLVASVIVGAFCGYAHPFVDGNGRWSRLVSASTARTRTMLWPAMVGAAFQNACKTPLSERILPEATSSGLRGYLVAALRFEKALFKELSARAVLDCAMQITGVLKGAAGSQPAVYASLARLYATGRLPITELKKDFGLSDRAANGLAQKAVAGVSGMVGVEGVFLDAGRLVQELDAGMEQATKTVFG